MVAATRLVATGAATTVTVVVAVLVASAWLVAVMVTLPGEAGAVKAPVEALIVPAVADQVRPVFDAPETELEKVVLVLTVMVGAAGLMAATPADCRVTPTAAVAVAPAALVTVRVKVLAAVRAPELNAVPEVTAPMPWSTAPVPPEKVGVRLVEPP